MHIVVTDQSVTVEDPDDMRTFDVRTRLRGRELADAVQRLAVGNVDVEHIWIDPAAVRRAAAPRSREWDRRFASMLEMAGAHGWVDASGRVRGHVVHLDD